MQYLEPTVIKQLAKELKNLNKNPLDGIDVIINDEDLSTIVADIDGPGTSYIVDKTYLIRYLIFPPLT